MKRYLGMSEATKRGDIFHQEKRINYGQEDFGHKHKERNTQTTTILLQSRTDFFPFGNFCRRGDYCEMCTYAYCTRERN
jgi:hypothetical protein